MTTSTIPTTYRGHRLGHDISGATSRAGALQTAGLDWTVDLVPAQDMSMFIGDQLVTTSIPGRRLAMRSDNHVSLETVGSKFTVVQNEQMFRLGDEFLKQGARPTYAGEIDHGRRVFVDFAFPRGDVALANGKDIVSFGASITNRHDGSGKLKAKIKGTRLWCTNGCTVDIAGLAHTFEIPHVSTAEARMEQAKVIMAGAGKYVAAFTGAAERLLSIKMSRSEFEAYIDALFPEPDGDAPNGSARAHNGWETRRGELIKLWEFADTNDIGRGTRWGAFNSVTEYLDWGTAVKPAADQTAEEARALRQFDDVNQALRNQAWNFALAA